MDIKELLGDQFKEGMSADELISALSQKNLADLSRGEYVSKAKYDDVSKKAKDFESSLNALKQQNMTVEEKAKLQQEELQNTLKAQAEQIAKFKLKESLIECGFNNEECKEIMSKDCSPKVYQGIMAKRLEQQEASLKAQYLNSDLRPTPPINEDNNKKSIVDYTMEEMNEMRINNPGLYNQLLGK